MSDKIQYWINQDGEQTGPLTLDQLELMTLSEKTYVWSAGFDDWKPLTEVPELAHLLPNNNTAATAVPPLKPESDSAPEPITGTPIDEPVLGTPVEGPVMGAPVQQPVVMGRPMQQPAMGQPAPAASEQSAPYPACPPTNMVWAIISTILCCLPLGIVAIIYANKVSKKYYEGDIAAAEHYSEVSAWWCIGTIVGGIILQPFVSLIQMSLMGA